MNDKVQLLEQRGAILLLLYIAESENTYVTAIQENLPIGRTALYTAINNLKELKLLDETTVHPYNKRVFKLSEKGKEVADMLSRIMEIL